MDLRTTRLTLGHLRLVVAVTEEHSLVGAARRLHLTQPAVTKALQAAEQQLGVMLFNRTSGGMVPTIYGEALTKQAQAVISQLNQAAQQISDLRDGTGGRIAVGTLLAASALLLPLAIARIQQERPRLAITLMEGTNDVLVPALRSGTLDLVVGRLTEFHEQQDLHEEILLTDTACIVVRPEHPLVSRKALTLAEVVECQWILPPPDTTLRRQVEQSFREKELELPIPSVESISFVLNRSLLLLSDYLSVWPWQVAWQDYKSKQVSILPISLTPTTGPIGVTTRRHVPLSPAAETFIQTLRSISAELERTPLIKPYSSK